MTASIYRGLKATNARDLTASSIDGYLSRFMKLSCSGLFFRTDFHPVRECMFELSVLTTLNIYKDYFKGRKRIYKLHKSIIAQVWGRVTGNLVCPNSSFSWRSCCVLYTLGFYDQPTSWSSSYDELKNFATNILLKLVIKSRTGIRTIG